MNAEVRMKSEETGDGGGGRVAAREGHSVKNNLCSSVPIGGPNPVFNIKNPSQNVRKIGKPMQGDASVFALPGGIPRLIPHIHRPMNAKTFIFNHFTHVPTAQLMSFSPPKNTRFMIVFRKRQFVNKCQRFYVHSCLSLRPHFCLFPLAF
jgi:hypothetical protein